MIIIFFLLFIILIIFNMYLIKDNFMNKLRQSPYINPIPTNQSEYDLPNEIKNELIEYNSNENNSINCEIAEDITYINNSINNLPNKYSIPIIVLK
jgi:hypothetical protein